MEIQQKLLSELLYKVKQIPVTTENKPTPNNNISNSNKSNIAPKGDGISNMWNRESGGT